MYGRAPRRNMQCRQRASEETLSERISKAEAVPAIGGSFSNQSFIWAIISSYRISAAGKKERMPKLPDTAYFEIVPDWICEVLSQNTARKELRARNRDLSRTISCRLQKIHDVVALGPRSNELSPIAIKKDTHRRPPSRKKAPRLLFPNPGNRRTRSDPFPSLNNSRKIFDLITGLVLRHTRTSPPGSGRFQWSLPCPVLRWTWREKSPSPLHRAFGPRAPHTTSLAQQTE